MTTRLPLPRVWIVMVLLCTLLVAPVVMSRVNASASGGGIVVIGDSISARYNDKPGNAKQAWWSVVGRHYHLKVTRFAESGSGYQRPGHVCTGTRFRDRLAKVKKTSPKIVIVEGGRNDWSRCTKGRYVRSNSAAVKTYVDSFLTRLKRSVPAGTRIYVLGPPWGTANAADRVRVTQIIKKSAARHHMTFIDTTGVFKGGHTVDGTHPDRAGSVALGKRAIKGIGLQLPL